MPQMSRLRDALAKSMQEHNALLRVSDLPAAPQRNALLDTPRSMSEEELYLSGNPIDDLRSAINVGSIPQGNPQGRETLANALLSITPGPGNVMSANDAFSSAGDAYSAFQSGDYKGGALSAALSGLSGVGAVTGLPFGKFAKGAADAGKRTLFSGGGPTAKTVADKPIYLINDVGGKKLDDVTEYMEMAGPPQISVVDMGDHYMALEGSHRLTAARNLGLTPDLHVIGPTDRLNPYDYDWGHNQALDYLHEKGLTAKDIAEILRDTSQNTFVTFPGIRK